MPKIPATQRLTDLLLANLNVVVTLLVSLAAAWLLSSLTDNAIVLNTVPLFAGALAVTAVAVALHPHLNWMGLGLTRRSLPGLLWGFLLGSNAVAALVLLAVALDLAAWVPWDPAGIRFDWRATPVAGLAVLAIGAAGEELFLRGLLLQLLARSITPFGAVAGTSLAFAVLHGANPGVTYLAQLNTALFGVLFGMAVLRQRSLWLAIGLHLGWNVAQVAMGSNVSGITIRLTGLNLDLHGVEWLNGGSYGMEGGAMASCAALLLAAVVWFLRGRRATPRTLWEAVPGSGFGTPSREPPPASGGGSLDFVPSGERGCGGADSGTEG